MFTKHTLLTKIALLIKLLFLTIVLFHVGFREPGSTVALVEGTLNKSIEAIVNTTYTFPGSSSSILIKRLYEKSRCNGF